MTFERPWLLLLSLLPLAWCIYEWRRHTRHFALITKTAMLLAISLALSGPVLSWHEHNIALAVVADTSASISNDDLAREQNLLKQIDSEKGSNEVDVIPFARVPRDLTPSEKDFKLAPSTGATANGSNLEAPVRQALASLPSGMLHRVLLISDGNENEGALTPSSVASARTRGADRHYRAGRSAASPDPRGSHGTAFRGLHRRAVPR